MSTNPLDTSDHYVPHEPREVAAALRDMADGESDYLGRLLMVAAHHIDAFASHKSCTDSNHLAAASKIAAG